MSGVLLAIETSQRTGGVAVRDGTGQVHVEWLAATGRHDDDLLPAIDRLYRRIGAAPDTTQGVGVSIGPGGFTGLRIALGTTKMLAEGLDAAVLAVPSAMVAAESYPGDGPVLVALASKRGAAWVTRLDRADDEWVMVEDGRLVNAEALRLDSIKAVLGDDYLPPAMRDRCDASGVPVIEPAFDPRACLAVAARFLSKGCTTDPLDLKPIYPRPPDAVVRKRG